jgi:hypothetical protein
VVFIFSNKDKVDSKVIDVVKECGNFFLHKQFEIKDGLLFMRIKKRSLNPVHA